MSLFLLQVLSYVYTDSSSLDLCGRMKFVDLNFTPFWAELCSNGFSVCLQYFFLCAFIVFYTNVPGHLSQNLL